MELEDMESLNPIFENVSPDEDGTEDTSSEDTAVDDLTGDDADFIDEPEETGDGNDPENDLEADTEDTLEGSDQAESETDEQTGESSDDSGATVSGNDIITISGNAVIFPEDFDLSLLSGSTESSMYDASTVVDAIKSQTDLIYGASAAAIFLLGVIAGILLIQGFRLRRT